MITINEIYWLAGLYEGEGSFTFQTTPRMQLKMTDEDIIVKARSLTKPNAKILIKDYSNKNHKTSYTFYILGDPAISWMMTIYSLMGRRRKEQIREVINNWNSMVGKNTEPARNQAQLIKILARARKISFEEAKRILEITLKVN